MRLYSRQCTRAAAIKMRPVRATVISCAHCREDFAFLCPQILILCVFAELTIYGLTRTVVFYLTIEQPFSIPLSEHFYLPISSNMEAFITLFTLLHLLYFITRLIFAVSLLLRP